MTRLKIAMLSNPLSQRNRDGMARIEAVLARRPDIRHVRFEPGMDLQALLAELAAWECGLIILNSGDGLVHARARRPVPGPGVRHAAAAGAAAARHDQHDRRRCRVWAAAMPARCGACSTSPTRGEVERHLVRRRVLKVEYDPDRPGERGMFFGAAGVYDGIHLCTGSIHTRGLTGSWASTSTILAILGRALWRGVEATGIGGDEIGVSVDGGPWTSGRRALVLATTLDRLVLGTRPFWNNGGEPIHFTDVRPSADRRRPPRRADPVRRQAARSARPAVPQPVGRPGRAAAGPAVHHRRRVLPRGARASRW